MSAPVDLPQNLHIHVAPAERIPQPKQPDPNENNPRSFQDYFERSEKDKIRREEDSRDDRKNRMTKQQAGETPNNPQEPEQLPDESVASGRENDLGSHVDMLA